MNILNMNLLIVVFLIKIINVYDKSEQIINFSFDNRFGLISNWMYQDRIVCFRLSLSHPENYYINENNNTEERILTIDKNNWTSHYKPAELNQENTTISTNFYFTTSTHGFMFFSLNNTFNFVHDLYQFNQISHKIMIINQKNNSIHIGGLPKFNYDKMESGGCYPINDDWECRLQSISFDGYISKKYDSIKFENDVKISFTLEDFDIYAPEKYFTQIVELFFKEFLPEKLCYLIEKRLYCKRKAIDQLPDKLIFEIGDTYFNLPLKRYFKTTWTVGLFEFIITSKPSMDSNTFTFGINMFENHLRVFDYENKVIKWYDTNNFIQKKISKDVKSNTILKYILILTSFFNFAGMMVIFNHIKFSSL